MKCLRCDGDGDEKVYDCLNRNVPREVGEFFQAFTFMEELSILPAPGGMQQQSATFVEAISVAMAEKGRILQSLRDD